MTLSFTGGFRRFLANWRRSNPFHWPPVQKTPIGHSFNDEKSGWNIKHVNEFHRQQRKEIIPIHISSRGPINSFSTNSKCKRQRAVRIASGCAVRQPQSSDRLACYAKRRISWYCCGLLLTFKLTIHGFNQNIYLFNQTRDKFQIVNKDPV